MTASLARRPVHRSRSLVRRTGGLGPESGAFDRAQLQPRLRPPTPGLGRVLPCAQVNQTCRQDGTASRARSMGVRTNGNGEFAT
jgi:hypothetical protein